MGVLSLSLTIYFYYNIYDIYLFMHLLNSFFLFVYLLVFFFLGGGVGGGLGTKASSEVTDKTSQHKHIINGMLVFKI